MDTTKGKALDANKGKAPLKELRLYSSTTNLYQAKHS